MIRSTMIHNDSFFQIPPISTEIPLYLAYLIQHRELMSPPTGFLFICRIYRFFGTIQDQWSRVTKLR